MSQNNTNPVLGTRINVDDVSKEYSLQNNDSLEVLADISFTIEAQGFTCLLGPSGCGKSTLMNLIAGLDSPTSGSIRLENEKDDATVAFVFQEPRLLDWRTVRENLKFGLRAMGVSKDEWESRIDTYLSLVGLLDFADDYPQSLSGGMKQRVALARAMAVESDVILMDEPFSSLDEITARELRRDLVEIWETEDKTILFVTHDPLEAAYLSEQIVVLSQRPASVVGDYAIDIPRPREIDDRELAKISKRCIDDLRDHI